jgi:hypothetical protein
VKIEDAKAKTHQLQSAIQSLVPGDAFTTDTMQLLQHKDGAETLNIDKLTPQERCRVLDAIVGRSCTTHERKTVQVGSTSKSVVEPQKITMTASLSSSYEYDSNAFSTKNGAVEDRYLATVPGVRLDIPIPKYGQLTYSVKAAYARYDQSTTLDTDILQGTAAYTTKLSSFTETEGSTTKRTEMLTARVVGKGVYGPGFSGAGTRIYSPALVWDLNGIAVGDRLCGKPKDLVNCWIAGISAELGQTWIGNSGSGKNTRTALTGTFDWNIHGSALVWEITGSVTDRYYEDYPGGRNDVFFSGGSTLTWTAATDIKLSAGVQYLNQLSTQETLEYNKYILVPQVVAKMSF